MVIDPVAISFKNVSKQYLTGERYYPSLRDWVSSFFSEEFFKGKKSFYALKNLSFAIYKGETVGFIGHNGAGKSTILKLISRVSAPTSGDITRQGKVAGLLELGAGFHPELTGRENIFFQGAILGMSKAEIAEKTESIIDFAGLGEFIDSPVKHFSSGMYARLGFSVAIHLDPDILLIDEVLAVGDIQFQEKCFSKIDDFCHDGKKTVVIVSHNLSMVKRLCKRVFLLNNGEVINEGEPRKIFTIYKDMYLDQNPKKSA